ncbi:YciI family protein [Actinoplanes sp. NPDC051470]|uniref:YciI family protein n=1 Tax=Actinoplanes sp. NPDC051470 TaxID=3157224 RepID=UPI00341E0338
MKQYMLAVQFDYTAPSLPDDEVQTLYGDVERVNEELRKAGAWVFGGGLLAPSSSTVVRVEGGDTTMTDGPYAETKETIGGFWVLRCADLDEALAWAEKCSRACRGPIEVRPFEDED